MSKVSICIPCYNNRDEVERLLESIRQQDYTNYEVNISDDSQNDEIAELVKDYEVNYIHNETPLGHIYNWNAAIRMARGEYIKIMFSDDWFTQPSSLETFVKMLEDNPNASLAFCGSRQVMLDKGMESYDRYAPDDYVQGLRDDYRNLFLGNQIGAPSAVIYRRGEALTLFDERSNWASDMFLYFDLLQNNPTFAYMREPLVSIGVHDHQYTESFTEHDMRIYNDYRYLYTKYQLQESEPCREYFTEKFIIRYHQGWREARRLGIESGLYWRKWWDFQKDTVRCFVNARLGLRRGE